VSKDAKRARRNEYQKHLMRQRRADARANALAGVSTPDADVLAPNSAPTEAQNCKCDSELLAPALAPNSAPDIDAKPAWRTPVVREPDGNEAIIRRSSCGEFVRPPARPSKPYAPPTPVDLEGVEAAAEWLLDNLPHGINETLRGVLEPLARLPIARLIDALLVLDYQPIPLIREAHTPAPTFAEAA
jgi:hypothetical protein